MKKSIKKTAIIIIMGLFIFGLVKPVFAQSTPLEPVVIIPGITGSWNWEVMLQRSGAGVWNFFSMDHTWDNLIDALTKAGYEKDKTLFVAFYDWRQNNSNSATDYLIPTIDRALVNSPTGKVNLIAHSMGGLVARQYLQSSGYRNDVNHLILLGTPNYGSSDVYTLWEGGIVPDNWGKMNQYMIKFYLWYMTTATIQTADNYDTIHTYIPSIKELLPTYDFLTDSAGNLKAYNSLTEAKNPFLGNLNNWKTMANLQRVGDITVVAGNGESTVKNVPVVARSVSETKLWSDGVPEPLPPARNSAGGDNRVLLTSAYLDPWSIVPPVMVQNRWEKFLARIFPVARAAYDGNISDFLKQKEITSQHGALPTTAIPEVFSALALPAPTVAYTPPIEPDSLTSFWFASPVEVTITDPQGRVITKDTNDIPGAIYAGESDPNGVKMVIIPNGLPGQYKLALTGTGNGEYHLAVANFTGNNDDIITAQKAVAVGEKIEYTVNIDANLPVPITIGEPVVIIPEPAKTAIELMKELSAGLDAYYQAGQIKNKGVYQALSGDLKLALKALEEAAMTRPVGEKYPKLRDLKVILAKKIALAKLNAFISKIETQSKNNKIDQIVAVDLITKTKAIIVKIKE